MLKSPTNGASSSRPPPSTSRNLLDSSFQKPANPPLPSGSPDKWEAYASGGAQEDDARLLQKRRREEAAFENIRCDGTIQPGASSNSRSSAASVSGTLIHVSPREPAASVSGNASLLVDLDINVSYDAHGLPQLRQSYASAAGAQTKVPGGSEWSLMD